MADPETFTADDDDRYDKDGRLFGSHVLKNPDDEYEIFDHLPKEVQDLIRSSPVKIRCHWTMLNCSKSQLIRIIRQIIAESEPPFESLTGR